MTYSYTVAERISSLLYSYANSKGQENKDHFAVLIEDFGREHLPHGSGLNGVVEIDLDRSNPEKIVINCEYHHMCKSGFYGEWTNHTVTITPSFNGFNIKISGRNRNDIKEYLYDVFSYAMGEVVEHKTMIDQPSLLAKVA